MKKYNNYKDSGVEWIGKIPQHWEIVKLKYVSNITRGAILRPVDEPAYFDENGEWTYLNISDATLCDKYLDYGKLRLSELGSEKSARVEPNNLIITASATIGKPFINRIPVCVHDGFIPITELKVDINFLYNYFKNPQLFNGLGKSNTQKNIYLEDVKNLMIPIPSEEEQLKIANYLDHKTTQIDNLIAKKEQFITLLQEERTAVINQAVTKGLDPNVKMKDSGIEWLGEIPEHWESWKIGHAFKKIGSGTTPESGNPVYHENGTINWLNTGDLNDSTLNECSKKVTIKALDDYSSLKLFPSGSLVMAMYGATIGKTAIINFETTTNQACCVFCNSEIIDLKFLQYWFKAKKEHIINLSIGGGQPNVSQQILKDIRLGCPDIVEQNKIVDFLDVKTIEIDTIISKTQQEIQLLKEYKTALISEVVTGKVDVRDMVLN